MKQLVTLLEEVLTKGKKHEDRTGTGRISIFGPQASFDLREGFPAMTIRKLHFKPMVTETLWFIRGDTKCDFLDEHNCKIWKHWTHPTENSVGPMYGAKLRHWPNAKDATLEWDSDRISGDRVTGLRIGSIDQLANAIEILKTRPHASDNVITLWDPTTKPPYFNKDGSKRTAEQNVEEGFGALANCHGTTIQFFAEELTLEECLDAQPTGGLRAALEELWLIDELEGICDPEMPYVGISVIDRFTMLDWLHQYFAKPKEERQFEIDSPELGLYITKYGLRVKMYQRSQDFLAIGFNIAQYALLTHMVAQVCGMLPLEYIQTWGDFHIYTNQVDAAMELIKREPKRHPELMLNPNIKDIDAFTHDDIYLDGYEHHPDVKMEISV